MIKKILNEKLEGDEYKMEENWIDFEVTCIKCDRFVESIDREGFCPECTKEERHEAELWEPAN